METTGKIPRSRTYLLVLKIAMYAQMIIGGIFLIGAILIATGTLDDHQVAVNLPLHPKHVTLDSEYMGHIQEEGLGTPTIGGGTMNLLLPMEDAKRIGIFKHLSWMVWLLFGIYITRKLISIVNRMAGEEAFAEANSKDISRIATAVMLLGPAALLLYQIDISVYHKSFMFSFGPPFWQQIGHAIVALLLGYTIKVLAQIFHFGSVLHNEQKLTV